MRAAGPPRRTAASSTSWTQVEVDLLELELAGLDLGEVQDVVDDRQQRLAGAADALGVLRAGRSSSSVVEQQAGQPDDAVHRRPDLVAHRGQEAGLQPGGLHRGVARGLEGDLGLFALGDVANAERQATHLRVISQVGDGDLGVDQTCPAREAGLDSYGGELDGTCAAAHGVVVDVARPGASSGWTRSAIGRPSRSPGGRPGGDVDARVGVGDGAVAHNEEQVRGRLENGRGHEGGAALLEPRGHRVEGLSELSDLGFVGDVGAR